MIPKVAHFYWHGEDALPKLRQESVDSFARMNPDWQHFVHHAGESSDPLWKRITRSDAARYGILHRAGGVYFDTDIIFVKPIPESWLTKDLILPSTFLGEMYGVHVLGATEGSPFFSEAMRRVKARMTSSRALGCQSLGVKLWMGSNVLDLAASANLDVTQVPIKSFLFNGPNDVEDVWSPGDVSPESIGVHWYGGDPLSRLYDDMPFGNLPHSIVRSALIDSGLVPDRTLARKGTFEVESWVARETRGYASALDFGSGLGAYTRVMDCRVKHGVEAFEPYVRASRSDHYNSECSFFLGDMRLFRDLTRREYDVALFVDTLEHLDKEDATSLLMDCQKHFKKIAILVPIGTHEQDPCDGNEMQRHLSTWYGEDLSSLGFSVVVYPDFHTGNPEGKRSAALATWVVAP